MSDSTISDYPFTMRHLSKEDGGGYLIEFPDLPGCMSDGETIEDALASGQEAVQAWIDTATESNRSIPKPGELENQSGKWVQRVPKSIHLRLVTRAREEGCSLNTLVITLLAESLAVEPPAKHKQRSHRRDDTDVKKKSMLDNCSCKKYVISSLLYFHTQTHPNHIIQFLQPTLHIFP
jgi:antitoxin HicB